MELQSAGPACAIALSKTELRSKSGETFNSGYFTLAEKGVRCELELRSQEGRLGFIGGRGSKVR